MTIDVEKANERLIVLSERNDMYLILTDFERLNPAQRVFQAVWSLESEVNNGGFGQLFSNSSGQIAPHMPSALREIGAEAMAKIVDAAIAAIGRDTPWGDDEARRERMVALQDAVAARLEELDGDFLQYPDDLTSLLYQFVSLHRSDFGIIGEI